MSSEGLLRSRADPPEAVILDMLGLGWSHKDWELHLISQNYAWNDRVKTSIISKEIRLFKDEILRLRSEPDTIPGEHFNARTNAMPRIWKRLRGDEWIKGTPNEKEQRLSSKRLLGKSLSYMTFRNHISNWGMESNHNEFDDAMEAGFYIQNLGFAPSSSAALSHQPDQPQALARTEELYAVAANPPLVPGTTRIPNYAVQQALANTTTTYAAINPPPTSSFTGIPNYPVQQAMGNTAPYATATNPLPLPSFTGAPNSTVSQALACIATPYPMDINTLPLPSYTSMPNYDKSHDFNRNSHSQNGPMTGSGQANHATAAGWSREPNQPQALAHTATPYTMATSLPPISNFNGLPNHAAPQVLSWNQWLEHAFWDQLQDSSGQTNNDTAADWFSQAPPITVNPSISAPALQTTPASRAIINTTPEDGPFDDPNF